MHKTALTALFLVLILVTAVACGPQSVPTPVPAAPSAAPTATSEPTATEMPSATREATPVATATPSSAELEAEAEPRSTFAQIGSRVALGGDSGVTGNVIVAGTQTLIIQAFTYDGNCPKAEVRLVHSGEAEPPVAILLEIEPRAYGREMLRAVIPDAVGPDDADGVIIYCPETQETLAIATFN